MMVVTLCSSVSWIPCLDSSCGGAVEGSNDLSIAHAHLLFTLFLVSYILMAVSEREWKKEGKSGTAVQKKEKNEEMSLVTAGPWFTSYVLSGCYLHDS